MLIWPGAMGRNKNIRKRIAGLDRAVDAHERKIETEHLKPNANNQIINHWRDEIQEWKKQIERLRKRLGRR